MNRLSFRSPCGPAFHPPAEHLVQRHEVGLACELRDDQGLLRRVELALGVEQTQRAIDASAIARFGQVVGPLRSRDERVLRRELVIDRTAACQRVGHFAKRDLDHLLVLSDTTATSMLASSMNEMVTSGDQRRGASPPTGA